MPEAAGKPNGSRPHGRVALVLAAVARWPWGKACELVTSVFSRQRQQFIHRYNSTVPIPGPNVPYLQRTTVPYPASPAEPLGTLTDRITWCHVPVSDTVLIECQYRIKPVKRKTPLAQSVALLAFLEPRAAPKYLVHVYDLYVHRIKHCCSQRRQCALWRFSCP